MKRNKRYPTLIRSGKAVLSAAIRLYEELWLVWNALPQHQLTRRGLMELGDEQLAELGLPRRTGVR